MLKKPLLKSLKITSLTNPLMKWQANQVVGSRGDKGGDEDARRDLGR